MEKRKAGAPTGEVKKMMAKGKSQALALLATGETDINRIADVCDLSPSSVRTLLRKMNDELTQEEIQKVATLDRAALSVVFEKAKKSAPTIVTQIDQVAEGVDSLQLLNTDFHTTLGKVLKKANTYLDEEELKVSDFVAVTNSVSNAYNLVFNSKGVNVNVNNGTQVSTDNLSLFKGAMRG